MSKLRSKPGQLLLKLANAIQEARQAVSAITGYLQSVGFLRDLVSVPGKTESPVTLSIGPVAVASYLV